ncbi:hypothetical protein HELRODRAFT_182019 [Helobdella robusta]|uniref:Uncharacterized protein n=1 Tax=Helobdella robusta TaxID=6412 RepID=T1FHL8_HELRO|nr:hypothetical protein HELRODRAFT_182019 [Helobdella robusta]ESN91844.1 hypothetical protein HELRODRAFT_182019 [Helobdella robusta]
MYLKMFQKLKAELLKYSENTTVRGIPKFIKSQEIFPKVLWLSFFLSSTAALIYMLRNLFTDYYSYPIATVTGEKTGQSITFPDITICNLNPFSEGEPEELSIENYLKLVAKYKKKWLNLSNLTNTSVDDDSDDYSHIVNYKQVIKEITDELSTVSGYLINLSKILPKPEDCPSLVVDCNVFGTDWFETKDLCTNKNFTRNWNANYRTCYTLQMSELKISGNYYIRGLSLLLNVGPPNFIKLPYKASLTNSQARGVQVSVHSPGTPADLKRGFSVAPGTENIVEVTQTDRKLTDKPHNKLGCTIEKTLTGYSSKNYARELCVEYCEQNIIKKFFRCVSRFLSVPEKFFDTVMCGNLSHYSKLNESTTDDIDSEYLATLNFILSQFFTKIKKHGYEYSGDECRLKCLLPCEETIYSTKVTSATWPQPSFELDLFQKYFIDDNDCMNNPKVKSRYINYYNRHMDEREDHNSFSNLTQIRESLLEIKFVMPQNSPHFQTDKPVYTADMMIGSVGGILSLWMGITVASAVEIMELLYFLLKCIFEQKLNKAAKETELN